MQIQRPWTSKPVPALGQLKVAVGRREKDQLHASLSPQKRGHIGTPSLAQRGMIDMTRNTNSILFGHASGLVNVWAIWRKSWGKVQRRRWLILD